MKVWLSTVATRTEADALARHLVESSIAACVTITSPVTSLYRWEGELCCEDELLLVIKAPASANEALKTAIKTHHPYAVPELICLDVSDGLPDYLAWVAATGP